MRDKSIVKQQLFSICLVLFLILGFAPVAVASPLADRIQQFPQWNRKPPLKLAKGDLEYPEWMAGTWNVTSILVEQIAPLAPDIVTPGFGDNQDYLHRPFNFQVRFGQEYYTSTKRFFPITPAVVADRAFNGENIAKAYLGDDNVYRVKVDPNDPNQQITLLKGERRLISKITGRGSEIPESNKFIASEYTKQLFESPASIYLNEVETTSAYKLLEPGKVTAKQMTAIYLSPQDPDYFQAGDRPVALYRYDLDLNQVKSALKLDSDREKDATEGEIMTFTGTIEKKGFGFGTWALVTDAGETYELKDPPSELQQSSLKVEIQGRIREDIMTIAMIGPVLEIESFKILEN